MKNSKGNSKADSVRAVPFPFSHIISFASDVDLQEPWHGSAIHRVINQEIGLPISDSVWIQIGNIKPSTNSDLLKRFFYNTLSHFKKTPGFGNTPSAFFTVLTNLNRQPSKVDNHPTYGLLLRRWHRGDIDTVHGWQEDYCPQIQNRFKKPKSFFKGKISLQLPIPDSLLLKHFTYWHLRLYFTDSPPDDMEATLEDDSGNRMRITALRINQGKQVQFQKGTEYIAEIPLDPGITDENRHPQNGRFNLAKLRHLILCTNSNKDECSARLIRIERDNFSRLCIMEQLPIIEKWNIRPPLLTCHGGATQAQNFAPPGFVLKRDEPIFKLPNISKELRSLGDCRTSHAYHGDLLKRLGVEQISGYAGSHINWNDTVPVPEKCYDMFYNLRRTVLTNYKTNTVQQFKHDLRCHEPALENIDLDEFYCPELCTRDQGVMIGLLVATGLSLIKKGKTVHHLWYTHLASGDSSWRRTPRSPLKPSVVKWLRKLANHHYNFDGTNEPKQRIWVPPAGTLARYRLVRSHIENHLRIDPENSRIDLESWRDPVTGRNIPDHNAGTRDLHGVTIYISDAERATLYVDGRESPFFTRNKADETGMESVTIVDNNSPTVILGDIPFSSMGLVETRNSRFEDISFSFNQSSREKPFVSIKSLKAGEASVSMRPSSLYLWNTTHMHFSYRKSCPKNTTKGGIFIEIEIEDGRRIAISEGRGKDPPRDCGAGWWITENAHSGKWLSRTLALSDMVWKQNIPLEDSNWKRPPLPIGRVNQVKIGIYNALPGDRLDMGCLMALRPGSSGEASDGLKLASGRVTFKKKKPAKGIKVEALNRSGGKHVTETNEDGYYFFYNIRKGEILEIAAIVGSNRIPPIQGPFISMRKNEAELDIDISPFATA